jgi:hypothetical protein
MSAEKINENKCWKGLIRTGVRSVSTCVPRTSCADGHIYIYINDMYINCLTYASKK